MERAAAAPKTQKIAKQKIKKARFILPSSFVSRAWAGPLDVACMSTDDREKSLIDMFYHFLEAKIVFISANSGKPQVTRSRLRVPLAHVVDSKPVRLVYH